MLLRSSSTPVLGSILSSSFTDSPNSNNINNHHDPNYAPIRQTKLTSSSSSHSRQPFSCNSSPSISDQFHRYSITGSIRRAQSEGNLEGLISYHKENEAEILNITKQTHHKLPSGKTKCLMLLETIPSFGFHNSRAWEEEDEQDDEYSVVEDEEKIRKGMGYGGECYNVVFNEEMRDSVGFDQEKELVTDKGLFLARGIGIDGGVPTVKGGGDGFGGGGGGFRRVGYGGDGGDEQKVEEYYKNMVEDNPTEPLFLRNYAQFLYQIKRDLGGAEEYYSRAILLDPKDGDSLSQYAKLTWELYGDEERATIYFERAVQASPQVSHVHAAYAKFLWEIDEDEDEDEDECDVASDLGGVSRKLHEGAVASTNA